MGENLDAKTKKKMEKEQEVIRQGAKELEKREKGKQATGVRFVLFVLLSFLRSFLILCLAKKDRILLLNSGRRDMHPGLRKRFVGIRDRLKNCKIG